MMFFRELLTLFYTYVKSIALPYPALRARQDTKKLVNYLQGRTDQDTRQDRTEKVPCEVSGNKYTIQKLLLTNGEILKYFLTRSCNGTYINSQVIQSDHRILRETIESDVGLLRNPISSGEHRSDLTGFSSDSGPEYIGMDPIGTSGKQLKDPLTLTKIRRSENRGKHKIRRNSVGFQQTLISDFELQQSEQEFLKISTRFGSNFTTIFLRFQSNFTTILLGFHCNLQGIFLIFLKILLTFHLPSTRISPRISLVFHLYFTRIYPRISFVFHYDFAQDFFSLRLRFLLRFHLFFTRICPRIPFVFHQDSSQDSICLRVEYLLGFNSSSTRISSRISLVFHQDFFQDSNCLVLGFLLGFHLSFTRISPRISLVFHQDFSQDSLSLRLRFLLRFHLFFTRTCPRIPFVLYQDSS